jgi:CheY-like chemotaxis protein
MERYYFRETPFKLLMQKRVADILLVCSNYDKFMLEEDGRIDELLFQEYVSLNLRYPPKFTQVSTADEAFEMLGSRHFDLIITMLSIGEITAIDLATGIKAEHPQIPIIVLTPISTRETMQRLKNKDSSSIDYIFSWQGNPNILLAMVKLIEDGMNITDDVATAGVQTIILVEDSVRYYSSYLPMIYRSLFEQARCLMTEGLNEWQQTMRMRARSKITLARNYEEAMELYETYKDNLLGIITDVTYKKEGETDRRAGLKLCEHIRRDNPELPILLQSSHKEHEAEARRYNASFIYKHSKGLLKEVKEYIRSNYGFGDFIFRDPTTHAPIMHAHDLWDLQHRIAEVPEDSFIFHVKSNDISKWLKARVLFSLAEYLRPKELSDFPRVQDLREFIIGAIKQFRLQEGRGTIAEFQRDRFDEFSLFSRIGNGSLGGKGRGLAFIDLQLKRNRLTYKFPNLVISIPRTVVLTTEIFDIFIENNNLFDTALSDLPDEEMLKTFMEAKLPAQLTEDLSAILQVITNPIAVRSSSLLEDSHYQPFAGIYSTWMLPNNHADISRRYRDLSNAIKAVFASTYFQASKDYMRATNNLVEEEKMAVIIQEVTGALRNGRCYPHISGVARSLNFYPVENEKAEDGIVNIALGLGKQVVEGGVSLRFSPRYPKKVLQLSDTKTAMRDTQKQFYALPLDSETLQFGVQEESNLILCDLETAEEDGIVKNLASTYDMENHRLRDGNGYPGPKVLTFSGILKYKMFPLPEIIRELLQLGREAMNAPIEIEFAVNLDPPGGKLPTFSFLQIRPIVENAEAEDLVVEDPDPERTLIFSNKAMGNGNYRDIQDIVYIRPQLFDPAHTKEMGAKIAEINATMEDEDKGYVLVVPGRLGSRDPWLGIPINWSQISNARVIVEAGLKNFRVDPSQGTHFFQNLTSLRNAYLTINPFMDDGLFNVDYLNSRESVVEDTFLRHVRLEEPLNIIIDGKTGRGTINLAVPGSGQGLPG